MRLPQSRKAQLGLICAVCTACVLAAYFCAVTGRGFGTLLRTEMKFCNFLAREGRQTPPDPRLIFLGIDEESLSIDEVDLDKLFTRMPLDGTDARALRLMAKQFPWPREIYALIMDKLFAAGANVVAFDLMFPTPSADDTAFRAALDRYADRVVIGCNFALSSEMENVSQWSVKLPADNVIPQTRPIDRRVGFVNFWTDEVDETVRRATFYRSLERLNGRPRNSTDEVFPSLSARVVAKAGLGHLVPPKPDADQAFRFTAPPGFGFRPLPLYQLFEPRYWNANFGGGESLRGKIVLIGPAASSIHDFHQTPLGQMLGPEIHLNAINALLHQSFLHETPIWMQGVLTLLGGFVAWMVSLLAARPIYQILRGLIAAAILFLLVFAAYQYLDLYTAFITPLLAMTLSGASCFSYEYILERVEKARTRRTLERYVSKDVVRELLDNRESLLHSLGGARKSITVLFSDLRGFTTLTESADAAALVTQLNEYFNRMVRIVFANAGTLDKFIGDGLMAHWGSIVSEGVVHDACHAVRTALQMRAALAALNEDWKPRGMPTLDFGIGINSGEAVVGNVGCDEKMEFSMIGDPINLAARIEGTTKEYRVDLLIGEAAAALVREAFVLRSVDLVLVRGKTRPVAVFTVIAERAGEEPDWLTVYEKGVRLYRQREFAKAAELFRETASLRRGDWLAEEYLRRAQDYLATPPGPSWDGAYVMTRK